MDIEHIKTFLSISKGNSVRQATDKLFLSPGTVNHHLRALEEQVGCRLIEPYQRGIRLTEGGERFLPYGKKIFSLLQEAETVVRQMKQNSGGVVLLDTFPNMCTYLLPDILKQFKEAYPGIEVRVRTNHTRPIVDHLLSGEIDVGVVRGPFAHSGMHGYSLLCEEMVPIVASSHPWAQRKKIYIEDFSNIRLLAHNRYSNIWMEIEAFFALQGVSLQASMELDQIETCKHMAMMGYGVAFLPYSAAKEEIEQGKLKVLSLNPAPRIVRESVLLYSKRKVMNSQSRLFIQFLKEYMKDWREGVKAGE